jgi:hypothetical protein
MCALAQSQVPVSLAAWCRRESVKDGGRGALKRGCGNDAENSVEGPPFSAGTQLLLANKRVLQNSPRTLDPMLFALRYLLPNPIIDFITRLRLVFSVENIPAAPCMRFFYASRNSLHPCMFLYSKAAF